MDYNIMIFSSPGCKYNEINFIDMKNFKKGDSVRTNRLENIGTLDISQLFNAFYNNFDFIFVIISGKIKESEFISEYKSFQKIIDEANRILERRGFTNQRIRIFHLNGSDYKKLNEDIKKTLRKIVKYGKFPNNNKIMDFHNFKQENLFKEV